MRPDNVLPLTITQASLALRLIPAGAFPMGNPPAPTEVEAFYMDRVPVTQAAYRVFVEAAGHRQPDLWERRGYPADRADHPVVTVSFEDAQAYAAWRGARLPTEAEWEKAARGTDGRTYPWGNAFTPENLNTSEGKTEGTHPVTAHPGGLSPYGVLDLAGNVWEWTTTFYREGEEWRVVKGGAWDFKGRDDARAFSRAYFRPAVRSGAIGFRCALSLAAVT